jgi:hypothetical protein
MDSFSPRSCGTISFIIATVWNWMSIRKSNGKNDIYSASEIAEGKYRSQSITKNPKYKLTL